MINPLEKLHKNGTMAFLVKRGLITPSAYRRLEIFVEVKALENQGLKKTQAIQQASLNCKVCERVVWKAMREFTTY